MTDVSIIIVNYNATELLEKCINSIVKYSDGFSYEIIVVDNNSIQGDIDALLKNYNGISLIKNSYNKGFGAANNQGAKIAKGKYLLLLNNDTIFVENTIKNLIHFFKEKEELILAGCRLLNSDLSLQASTYRFPTPINILSSNLFLYKLFPKSKILNKEYYNHNNICEAFEVDVVIGAFMFISKNNFANLNGFDERFEFYHEDTDLCFRIKKEGGKIYYLSRTSLIHIGGGTSKRYLWFHYKKRSESLLKFVQKHYTGFQFIVCILFHYIGMLIRIPILIFLGIVLWEKNLILRGIYSIFTLFIYPENTFKNKST